MIFSGGGKRLPSKNTKALALKSSTVLSWRPGKQEGVRGTSFYDGFYKKRPPRMKNHPNILIVDDDDLFTASLSDFLESRGFRVKVSNRGGEGCAMFEQHHPPIVLLDQRLPDMSGVEVCQKILEIDRNTKVIFMTAYATVPFAVGAMQAGASDYLPKPFELDELLLIIRMAEKNAQIEGRLRLRDYEQEKVRQTKQLIGSSGVMLRIRAQMKLAAASEATVLITGETGVGKNVVAEGIHELQNRRENLLTVNCSSIPENLMDAEYFGHEKGVFTGADSRREGIFELANHGTLILDEIAEIPLHLQSKLLTVLEDKRVRRIGGGRSFPVDVRIMATTNQDLERAIEENRFRKDLYYRIAVFHMHIPPLRAHPEDIPEIARHFVNLFARDAPPVPEEHMRRLMDYAWPGNIRELRNVIERACLLRQGRHLKPADILERVPPGEGFRGSKNRSDDPAELLTLDEMVRRHIETALRACSGNKTMAARVLNVPLSTLKRRLKKMYFPKKGSN